MDVQCYIKILFSFQNTTFAPPSNTRFLRKNFPDEVFPPPEVLCPTPSHPPPAAASAMDHAKEVRVSTNGKVRSYVTTALEALPVRRLCRHQRPLHARCPLPTVRLHLAARPGQAARARPGGEQGGDRGGDHQEAAARPAPEHADRPRGPGRLAGRRRCAAAAACHQHRAVAGAARPVAARVS